MTNNLLSLVGPPARVKPRGVILSRREAPCPNPHIAELRELFALACRFGLTSAERDEWQARFDHAIAALEAEIAASERGHNPRRLSERATRAGSPVRR